MTYIPCVITLAYIRSFYSHAVSVREEAFSQFASENKELHWREVVFSEWIKQGKNWRQKVGQAPREGG